METETLGLYVSFICGKIRYTDEPKECAVKMTEISFLCGEVVLAATWLLLRAAVWIRQKRIDWTRELKLLVMYINLAVILRFSFFPFSRADGTVQPLVFDKADVFPFRVNLIPFFNILDYDSKRDLLLNIIGNVGMFIPSGIVLPILYRNLDCLRKVVLAGACMSLCIELLQLPFRVRASDIDDLILNTLGVIIGYGLYAAITTLIRHVKNNARIQ